MILSESRLNGGRAIIQFIIDDATGALSSVRVQKDRAFSPVVIISQPAKADAWLSVGTFTDRSLNTKSLSLSATLSADGEWELPPGVILACRSSS